MRQLMHQDAPGKFSVFGFPTLRSEPPLDHRQFRRCQPPPDGRDKSVKRISELHRELVGFKSRHKQVDDTDANRVGEGEALRKELGFADG